MLINRLLSQLKSNAFAKNKIYFILIKKRCVNKFSILSRFIKFLIFKLSIKPIKNSSGPVVIETRKITVRLAVDARDLTRGTLDIIIGMKHVKLLPFYATIKDVLTNRFEPLFVSVVIMCN